MKIATLILSLLILNSTSMAANFGKVSFLVGNGHVLSQKTKKWKPAKINTRVNVGDKIKVFNESRMEIKCVNGGTVRLDQNSCTFE